MGDGRDIIFESSHEDSKKQDGQVHRAAADDYGSGEHVGTRNYLQRIGKVFGLVGRAALDESCPETQERGNAKLAKLLEALSSRLAPDEISRATTIAEMEGRRVDRVLGQLGVVPDDEMAAAWSLASSIPLLSSRQWTQEQVLDGSEFFSDMYKSFARVAIIKFSQDDYRIAVGDPLDDFSVNAARRIIGANVLPYLATTRELDEILAISCKRQVGSGVTVSEGANLAHDVDRLRDLASDAPVVRAVASLLESAVDRGASDIHVAATNSSWSARLRVDGVLEDILPPAVPLTALVSRIKILAGLDIAERRLPQDGRIRIPIRGKETDLRIATAPHVRGEGAVIRILDRGAARFGIDSLGLSYGDTMIIHSILAEPHGLVVITGPTGSGKTTTLYSMLKEVATPFRNVVSVEDPVEMRIEGVGQIQVQSGIGLDFASTLRSVLRQDPDVIMVGEIRDKETAVVANQAALTGHLVLASLHTNSALGALPRLIDMGIEPYLLASTIRASISQRLVRKLCGACRRPASPDKVLWRKIGEALEDWRRDPPESIFSPQGCHICRGTGFKGRKGLFEAIPITEQLREAISRGEHGAALEAHVDRRLYPALAHNALSLVADGLTTLDEVVRTLGVS